jgi:hypothetical protein
MQVLTLEVDRSSKRPYNTHIATKEPSMLKLIGIAAVVYIGWITGLIQATLMITAGVLIAVAGA